MARRASSSGTGQQIAVRGEPVAEDEGAKAARGEPVGHLAALQVAARRAYAPPEARSPPSRWRCPVRGLEDGQGGDVFAGVALGLGSVAGPQADGLNAQKGVVVAGRGAGCAFARERPSRPADRQPGVQRTVSWEPRRFREDYKAVEEESVNGQGSVDRDSVTGTVKAVNMA